jgi:hypothetical protein
MLRNSTESRGLVSSASTMSVMMKRRWFETVAWKKQASMTLPEVRDRIPGGATSSRTCASKPWTRSRTASKRTCSLSRK